MSNDGTGDSSPVDLSADNLMPEDSLTKEALVEKEEMPNAENFDKSPRMCDADLNFSVVPNKVAACETDSKEQCMPTNSECIEMNDVRIGENCDSEAASMAGSVASHAEELQSELEALTPGETCASVEPENGLHEQLVCRNAIESKICSKNGEKQIGDPPKSSSIISSTSRSKKSKKKHRKGSAVGTSENPLDVTELLADSGSLLELYQNDYFDAYMHMHHLYHRNEAGVHEYLVNLLYSKRTNEEILFYLPQLCHLSIAKCGKSSLHRFLLDKASSSMHFALQLSWFYQAIIEDQLPKVEDLAQKMTQETEMAVVNCKLISPVPSSRLGIDCDRNMDLSFPSLLDRKLLITSITANINSQKDPINSCRTIDSLEKPKMLEQLIHNSLSLVYPASKVRLPTPYTKIGNPLDLETHPSFDCTYEMQIELQRLMMKQRRLDYFNTLNNFVRLCVDVSNLLTTESKRDAREPMLRLFAGATNEWMLLRRCVVAAYEESFAYTGLSLPLKSLGLNKRSHVNYQFLRIVESETKIFFSRKRAPFVAYVEIANLDEDVHDILKKKNKGNTTSFHNNKDPDSLDGQVTFKDLYVFDAIVKDLLSYGMIKEAEVNAIQNPLECIRYAMGMIPKDSLGLSSDGLATQTEPPLLKREPDEPSANGDSESFPLERGEENRTSKCNSTEEFELKSDDGMPNEIGPSSNRDVPLSSSRFPNVANLSSSETRNIIWPELLAQKKERLRRLSPYGKLRSWDLCAVVIKGGDDLRQENMVNQLLILFKEIFERAKLPLWLRPVEILVTGASSGVMEFLHDTCSVDSIKRKFNTESVAKVFDKAFSENIFEARKNFIESHAAYSIISYLLQVKDRHNGNMMLDCEGHVIHIDYGFCLSNCPGNINFETSPFKLTKEYLDIIGGENSDNFDYFRTLVIRGLLEARKHVDRIVLLVEMMTAANKMPCFVAGTTYTIEMLRDRFMLHHSEESCIERIVGMIEESVNNFRTVQYDNYQRLTNGIK